MTNPRRSKGATLSPSGRGTATLPGAPEQALGRLRHRTAVSGAASPGRQGKTSGLASVNERLLQEISKRQRVETKARKTERCLQEVRTRFESAFEHAPIGMALIDTDGHWLQVNSALCRITGHTRAELKATTLSAITHVDDVDTDALSMAQLLAGRIRSYQVEKRYRHAWGHDVWVLVTKSIVRDEARNPLYVVTQVQDISERKTLARHLEDVVDHDFLTGLYNRRYFEQELARETERAARYGTSGAVLLIDLDNFKDVNDTFGHRTGDDVLKGVAGLLRHRLRHTDVVARLGGDEFAVLLTQTGADHAQDVAAEVVKALGRETAVLAEQSIRITASVGVAMLDGLTHVEVLAYADLAMYEAKEAGRNRFTVYRPLADGSERVSARLVEVERIRHALEEDRLILYCQPILDLGSNEIRQHELLLRLPAEDDGAPLLPSAFLYSAERSGLIQAIDGWVARRAIGLIAEQARAGRRLELSVNLSGKSITGSRLAALIEDALTESRIDPAQLVFELTETAALSNLEDTRDFVIRLHGRGCRFALDDFGAGLGSFHYLESLPFDHLKIDGDFIRGLAASPVNQLLVSAIVGVARGLGKRTVAEFVADEETLDLLRKLGVDLAQGYNVGMPRPVSEVLRTT
jgi:diguanylate cyclase (GGDEF)-like protein/PAS domain S-box-containing protein